MNEVSLIPEPNPAGIFVRKLAELSDSDLRALRRATGRQRGRDVGVYDIFTGLFRPIRRKHIVTRWAYYLAATLYPWHPRNGPPGNLGAARKRLRPPSREKLARERADRRFIRLLDARGSDLCTQLLLCIRELRKADVAINWPQLVEDLSGWYRGDHQTQRAWAESYFKS